MLGYPIHPEIQKTLNERKQVLKRNKNPYKLTKGKNPSKEIQKNIVRTPYISMLSSPKLVSPTGNLDNENFPSNEDIILSNQEYSRAQGEVNFSPINYGFELYSDVQKQGGKYKYEPDKNSDGTQRYQSQFKAQPGIISLTSEYQSTSNVYFVRRVSITWKCHHLDDLERLSYRFLTLNRLVYIEWGWNYADKPATTFITPENLENIRNPRTLRRKVIEEGKGNFDAVIGYIENFEWTSTGGGFECRTDIVSQGSDILSQRINDDVVKIKKEKFENERVPIGFEEQKIPVFTEGLGVDNLEEATGTFDDVEFKTIKRAVTADRGTTTIQTQEDGSVDIQTERGLEFTESFNFVLNNLHLTIQELFTDPKDVEISKTTLFANQTEVEQKYDDLQKEKDDEYDEIENKVREEYYNNDFSNWPNGVKGFGIGSGGRIKREADRRFREQNSDTSYNRIIGGQSQITRQQKAQELNSETTRNRNETITKQIKYDKNLIQASIRTRYQRKASDYLVQTGTYVGPEDTTETLAKETWIRWGWFEDNILNRFFGLVNKEGTPILEFRSIRERSDKEMSEMAEKIYFGASDDPVSRKAAQETAQYYLSNKKFYQEKIHNHPNFLTEDIYKFIFPGKFKLGDAEEQNNRFESESKSLSKKGFEERGLFKKGATEIGQLPEMSAAKLFIKRDQETAKIIDAQILITGDIQLSEIEKILSAKTVGDVFSGGRLGDEVLKSVDIEELKLEAEKYRFLKVLELVLRDESTINSFDDPSNDYRGILRNVFINVEHLKIIFKDMTTLGGGISQLLESFNSSAPIFSLVPMLNVAENDGQVIFTSSKFLPDYLPDTEDIYTFPIKITESFIKSTNLASDITSEGVKILLSKRYAEESDNIIDKKTGGNIAAQLDFDRQGTTGILKLDNAEYFAGVPPYQFARLGDKFSKWGQKDGDFTKPLSFTDGIDFGVITNPYNVDKIRKNITTKEAAQDEKTTETLGKVSVEFPGNYTENGQLKISLKEKNKKNQEEEDKKSRFKEASPYDELGLLFLTNTMSMDGIAGIHPGNIYTSNYLPDKFTNNGCYFFMQNVSQTIDASTWTTEVTGRVLWNFKRKNGNIGLKERGEVVRGEESDEIEVSVSPNAFSGDVERQ
jgi:hypothetical protein